MSIIIYSGIIIKFRVSKNEKLQNLISPHGIRKGDKARIKGKGSNSFQEMLAVVN